MAATAAVGAAEQRARNQSTARATSSLTREHVLVGLADRVVAAVAAPDDVIEDRDAEDAPGADEPLGDFDVLAARRHVAAWVVVSDQDRDGARRDAVQE